MAGPAGDGARFVGCDTIGGTINGVHEFGSAESVGGPGYCRYQDGTVSECVSSTGGVDGRGVSCARRAFLGAPLECCNKDYDSNPGPGQANCFTTNGAGGTQTCDPEYRGPKRSGCRTQYQSYCLEGAPAGQPGSYTEKWLNNNSPCVVTLTQNYQPGVNGGQAYSQALLGGLMNRYFNVDGFKLTQPGQPGFNVFQDRILELANKFPNAAAPFLQEQLCTVYSRTDASKAFNIASFCGCYLPANQYQTTQNQVGLSKQCDPLCTFATAVPLVNGQGVVQKCQQTVCIINDVSVNLVNSRGGDISFNQLCGNCNDAGCSCSIVDVNINAQNSTIGDINLKQNCTSTNCFKTNPDNGQLIPVSCDATANQQDGELETGRQGQANEDQIQKNNKALRITVISVGVAVFVLLIVGLLLIFWASGRKTRV